MSLYLYLTNLFPIKLQWNHTKHFELLFWNLSKITVAWSKD